MNRNQQRQTGNKNQLAMVMVGNWETGHAGIRNQEPEVLVHTRHAAIQKGGGRHVSPREGGKGGKKEKAKAKVQKGVQRGGGRQHMGKPKCHQPRHAHQMHGQRGGGEGRGRSFPWCVHGSLTRIRPGLITEIIFACHIYTLCESRKQGAGKKGEKKKKGHAMSMHAAAFSFSSMKQSKNMHVLVFKNAMLFSMLKTHIFPFFRVI